MMILQLPTGDRMYRIDKATNTIQKLEQRKFSDLGFKERDHLQEWLANYPEALGESLLIIQKEFNGFDDTNERLDLLALDKEGNLVVIENKLDDSGRDVTWQAMKYVSYCSTLTKAQILDIYQKYIDKYEDGGDARSKIVEFLEEEDFDSLILNKGTDQRIMLVANNYRKEVTSTVLWLMEHQIEIQCFKATPYSMGDELFLQIEQIIPTPEAKDFMIGINIKEQESKNSESELKNRHHIRFEFWKHLLEQAKQSKLELFNNISPTKDHWISAGSGVRSVPFTFVFLKQAGRVELYISRSNTEENKLIFNELYKMKDSIEASFGDDLEWERLEDKKASRIKYEKPFDGYNKESWNEMISFMVDAMERLERAFKEPLAKINTQLKSQ
jgi:hypothetical protein